MIDGKEIYIDPLETTILMAFRDHLYLTNSEMADILIRLANKLKPKDNEKNTNSRQ